MSNLILGINFHGVGTPPPSLSEGQSVTWLPLDAFRRILDRVAGEPRIRLSFDDGYESDREIVLDELRCRNLTATFFLIVDELGAPGRVAAGDVGALARAGMAIGSHGMRHRRWPTLSDDELASDLAQSRAELARLSGTAIDSAACPFGSYDRRVVAAVRRAGYERLFTSDGGWSNPRAFIHPRASVRSWDDAALVGRLLHPHPWDRCRRRAARTAKAWR